MDLMLKQTKLSTRLGAAEVIAQGEEGVTGARRDGSDIRETVLWLR